MALLLGCAGVVEAVGWVVYLLAAVLGAETETKTSSQEVEEEEVEEWLKPVAPVVGSLAFDAMVAYHQLDGWARGFLVEGEGVETGR